MVGNYKCCYHIFSHIIKINKFKRINTFILNFLFKYLKKVDCKKKILHTIDVNNIKKYETQQITKIDFGNEIEAFKNRLLLNNRQ